MPVYCKPSNRVYFGDGEVLSNEVVNALIDAHDACLYHHDWQTGDILVLDNHRFMHGRTMTKQACERVLTSRFGFYK